MEIPENLDILIGESMKKYTTLGIGGAADYFVRIHSKAELFNAMEWIYANNLPYVVIGKGSKLLVKDGGVRGAVLQLVGMNDIIIQGRAIIAEAHASLIKLSKLTVQQGLRGLEWAGGIPASVGGAVVMNAGAYDGVMEDVVAEVEYFDGKRTLHISVEDCEFEHRKSIFTRNPQYIITSVRLELVKDSPERLMARAIEVNELRKNSQPSGKSAGSIFKKVGDTPAGLILDKAGLKGYAIGDAVISPQHANFIINNGNATSKDVLSLIEIMKKAIEDSTGITPELEIRIIGED